MRPNFNMCSILAPAAALWCLAGCGGGEAEDGPTASFGGTADAGDDGGPGGDGGTSAADDGGGPSSGTSAGDDDGPGDGTSASTDGPGDDATDDGPGDDGTDTGEPGEGHYFPAGAVWTTDITDAPLDPESDTVIAWLQDQGWGTGTMRIDFSITVLEADASTPFVPFEPTEDHYLPDCDLDPVPMPPGGSLEGESGYACESDGDCHLIVVDWTEKTLWEMWRANLDGDTLYGGCLAIWDLSKVYGPKGRGDQCSSADAAGFPIAPLLFSADEVAAGEVNHAIRFILPNATMRAGVYVRPATHAGGPSGPDDAVPYGARLRLRADYPLDTLPNDAARTVARAMQTYGMVLADGGNIALTAQSDVNTTAKWDDLMDSYALADLQPDDFEMIDAGERIELTYDCVREP